MKIRNKKTSSEYYFLSLKNIVIHTPTHEDYLKVISIAAKLGYTWGSGTPFDENDLWDTYKESTCINIHDGSYTSLNYYIENDYVIKSTQWFLDNFGEKEEEEKKEEVNPFVYYVGDGNLKRGAEIIKVLEKLGGDNIHNLDGAVKGTIYFIDSWGYIDWTEVVNPGYKWLTEHYKKAELPWKPKDKELVWAWNNSWKSRKVLTFYDSKNQRPYRSNGQRSGKPYDNYAPYEGKYPDWAKDAQSKLED